MAGGFSDQRKRRAPSFRRRARERAVMRLWWVPRWCRSASDSSPFTSTFQKVTTFQDTGFRKRSCSIN